MQDLEDRVRWADRKNPDEDPLEFYKQHYDGMSRGKLEKEDPGLYHRLKRARLLDAVPTTIIRFNDPIEYYKNHYPELTRGQLKKTNPSLYQTLWKAGLLESVPLLRTTRKYIYGSDPVAYYKSNYPGLTRSQLFKANPTLYNRLRKYGLLDFVPRAPRYSKIYGKDPIEYYRKNYYGLTRRQLKQANQALYQKLRRSNLLHLIPKKR